VFRGQPARSRRIFDAALLSQVDRTSVNFAFWLVAGGYVIFSLVDCLTTSYGLAHGGRERNPIAASLYASYGIGALFALKAAIVAVIVLTLQHLPRRPAVWVGVVFAAAMGLVVSANLAAITPH
jgi:hypothetical protein